jgi:hypothetical protein
MIHPQKLKESSKGHLLWSVDALEILTVTHQSTELLRALVNPMMGLMLDAVQILLYLFAWHLNSTYV